MTSPLDLFEKLIQNKKVEFIDGIFLCMDEEINITLYKNGEDSVLKFNTPLPWIEITKLGATLVDILRPSANKLILTPEKVIIMVNRGPDFKFDRKEIEAML